MLFSVLLFHYVGTYLGKYEYPPTTICNSGTEDIALGFFGEGINDSDGFGYLKEDFKYIKRAITIQYRKA